MKKANAGVTSPKAKVVKKTTEKKTVTKAVKGTKISRTKAAEIITSLGGRFANVTFTKVGGGDRNMTFCLRKDKDKKAGNPSKLGNLVVKDMFTPAGETSLRTIPLGRVKALKANGMKYIVE